MLSGRRLLRAPVSGWHAGTTFPSSSTTGPTVPLSSLTTLNFGTAYTAAGVGGDNTGWTVSTTGVWTTSAGAVYSKLKIPFNLDVPAVSGGAGAVTIRDCVVTTGGAGYNVGISLRGSANTVIQDCIVAGIDATANRMSYGIDSIFGSDLGLLVQRCELYWFRQAFNMSAGVAQDNYLHDPGYQAGDHTDGFESQGAAASSPLTCRHNTILMDISQTAPFDFGSNGATGPVQYITMDNNLLAGGGYCAYLGNSGSWITAHPGTSNHVVFTNNRISRMFFPNGGANGPYTAFDPAGTGNVFSGNVWHETGVAIT